MNFVSIAERRRLYPILAVALLFCSLPAPVPAQWPPWLKSEDEKEPVYPEIVISQEELAASGARVIDARDRESFLEGHIPGAVSIPFARPIDPGTIEKILGGAGIGREDPIAVYSALDRPDTGAFLFWTLERAGQKEVRFLDGGFEAWMRSGGAVDRSEPERRLAARGEAPVDSSSVVATIEYVLDRYGEKGFEIIDARDSTAWRSGHIPQALPFDYRSVIGSDGTFMTGPEIREIFARVGPRPSTTIDLASEFIVCDDGAGGGGALCYLVLRIAGIEKVRYFPGGWDDWSRNPGAPVVRIEEAAGVEDLLERGGALLVDVRNARDFEIAHVPGAISIPSHLFRDSLDTVLERHRPDADRKDLTLVTYCYGEDCIRSRQCASWAARRGFFDLRWFLGGIREWRMSGREIETSR